MACHTKIFPMKKTTEELKMSDLNAGKFQNLASMQHSKW
jgi:hypothetical protein